MSLADESGSEDAADCARDEVVGGDADFGDEAAHGDDSADGEMIGFGGEEDGSLSGEVSLGGDGLGGLGIGEFESVFAKLSGPASVARGLISVSAELDADLLSGLFGGTRGFSFGHMGLYYHKVLGGCGEDEFGVA